MLYDVYNYQMLLIFILAPIVLLSIFYCLGEKEKEKEKDNEYYMTGDKLEKKVKLYIENTFHQPALKNVIFNTSYGIDSEVDVIQVNKKGIFIIECKYRNGDISGSAKSDVWDVSSKDEISTMPNTIRQNYYHIKAMKSYLEQYSINMKDIPIYNISIIYGEGKRDQAKDLSNKTIKMYSSLKDLEDLIKLPDVLNKAYIKRIHSLLSMKIAKKKDIEAHIKLINNKYN